MLGRTERESGAHALAAARQGEWDTAENRDEPSDLLNLGSMTQTLATVARLEELFAVMHLGHPAQPDPMLERALLASPAQLRVTAAQAVAPRWVWVSRSTELDGHVIVDEAGMRDCRHELRTMGGNPHLVPARATLADRIALAGEHGSIVVERDNIPAGFHELVGSERLAQRGPLWYGMVQAVQTPAVFTEVSQVWLAFGPRDDFRGSLQQTLSLIAEAGIDLQHLRSAQSVGGPHVFFSAFRCPDSQTLDALHVQLSERGISHRVLGVLPGQAALPGPDAVEPLWAQQL